MWLRLITLLAIPPLILLFGLSAAAKPTVKKTSKQISSAKVKNLTKVAGASPRATVGRGPASIPKSIPSSPKSAVPSVSRGPASIPVGAEANRAVEIRGQSRTLSMMLVLKNSKDSINFIKVRKDYGPEIGGTQY
jgi:hypothetical protein